jgi:hypothetical protein
MYPSDKRYLRLFTGPLIEIPNLTVVDSTYYLIDSKLKDEIYTGKQIHIRIKKESYLAFKLFTQNLGLRYPNIEFEKK